MRAHPLQAHASLCTTRRRASLRSARGPASWRCTRARVSLRSARGQATVELVALLPLVVVLLAGVWQAALAGHAVWAATAAARAAARAHAVGADPRQAARTHLPAALERGLRVNAGTDGDVRVTVRIPALPGLPSPGSTEAVAHFEPQS
jgi:hypothetical protein